LPKVNAIGIDSKGDVNAVINEKRDTIFVADRF
jgi:hypothetical protein